MRMQKLQGKKIDAEMGAGMIGIKKDKLEQIFESLGWMEEIEEERRLEKEKSKGCNDGGDIC